MVNYNSVRATVRLRPPVMWAYDGETFEVHTVRPADVDSRCAVIVVSQGMSRSLSGVETADLPPEVIEKLREARWVGLPERQIKPTKDYIRWRFSTYGR